ncbi:PEP-CTERM sorting domain-containing protein [Thiobacillus sp.]
MRKWIHALTLMLALSAAFPSVASTLSFADANDLLAPPPAVVTPITGVDGPLAPATDYTLSGRADGLFDFSSIDLGAGITLRFDPQTRNVTLLSLGDILIAGMIDASGIQLALETPGKILVSGSILADTLSLSANTVSLLGSITLTPDAPYLPSVGNITIRGPGSITLTVPEPATPWLVLTLLPLLILLGRKRTSRGC